MLTVCVRWNRPADKQFNFGGDTWSYALPGKHGKHHGSEPAHKFTAVPWMGSEATKPGYS